MVLSEEEYYQVAHQLPPDFTLWPRQITGVFSYTFTFYTLGFVVSRVLDSIINKDETNPTKHRRLRNLIVCTIHSIISGVWAMYLFISIEAMRHDWIHYYSPTLAKLLTMSIGYFVYDAVDMIRFDPTGKTFELIIHHVASIAAFMTTISSRKFCAFAATALLFEINSIFLHLRAISRMLGYDLASIRALNIITFVPCRFGMQMAEIAWLYSVWDAIHPVYWWQGCSGSIFFLISNSLLFYRVLCADGWLHRRSTSNKDVDSFLDETVKTT